MSNDLDDLGVPPWLRKPYAFVQPKSQRLQPWGFPSHAASLGALRRLTGKNLWGFRDTQRSWGIRIISDTDNWIILMVQHTHTIFTQVSHSGLNPNMPEPGSANRAPEPGSAYLALWHWRALQQMDIIGYFSPGDGNRHRERSTAEHMRRSSSS